MEKHTMPVFSFAFLQSQETGQRGGSSIPRSSSKTSGLCSSPCSPMSCAGLQKKGGFQGFSADCRAAGERKIRGQEQRKEGRTEGSQVRESVAFKVWNRGEGAGLQGGCVSTRGGHWLKCELELFHLKGRHVRLRYTHKHMPTQGIN